ncbi:MAG: helix-turn-helix transcriptional regulator [Pseudomonadota bacterium]
MATAAEIISTLKDELRVRRVTYRDVAASLDLSESNIKRMFATGRMSLDRLEAICTAVGLDIGELTRLTEKSQRRISRLTEAQEQELVTDPRQVLLAVCAKNGWTFEEMVSGFELSEPECISLLLALERMGLIELNPGNRIRLLFEEDFRWRAGGPIERYFEAHLLSEFLADDFHKSGHSRVFLNGWITPESHERILGEVRRLSELFNSVLARDTTLAVEERQHIGLLMACRPCRFSLFAPWIGPADEDGPR